MPLLLDLTKIQSAGTEITTNAQDLAFLQTILNEHLNSQKLKDCETADKYYRNENLKIAEKTRFVYVEDQKKTLTNLSNTQTAHAFMKKLVNQKASYLCGKPFSLDTEQDKLEQELDNVFTRTFYRRILKVAKDAVKYGTGWLQVYYNEQGQLSFKRVPTTEIIPFWKDAEHEELEAILKTYTVQYYGAGGKIENIRKAEYYDKTGAYYFEIKDGKFIPDSDRDYIFKGHFALEKEVVNPETGAVEKKLEEQVWLQIPFICFKANDEELGVLTFIKGLIDDYDKNTSDVSDQLQDTPNAIKVVKGYSGEDKDEFAHNLNVYRTVFLDGDGEITAVQTNIDIVAVDAHLERLRKDIYEFGGGVDSQKDTQNMASGVALKFRYADLDLDAKFMATEFSASMARLFWFVCTDLSARGLGDYEPEEVEVVWNMDMTLSENEVIQNIVNSTGILSKDTLIANHPWVSNVEKEKEKMAEQKKEEMAEYGNIDNGSQQMPDNTDDEEE